ncbi:DoxX family protein [Flavobacterium sp.]|uniref:DoxX family protein n=1 Tax=Flavobacterium sp. TaxID=239 RepID=UPI002601BD04|nr:DoxX family protein [Flavobacterium sp.]
MKAIFKTADNYVGLIIRLSLGGIVLPHGAQKMLGWFGGYGFTGTMNFFTETLHLPWIIGFLVIVIEFVGAISILLGFAVRIWAAAIVVLFSGIILTSHIAYGFFMNWFGNQKGEGYEFHLLIIGLALALLLNGSGKLGLDQKKSA